MSESTKTEETRDFSKLPVEVCEVARFDNDGHLAGIGNEPAAEVSNADVAVNQSEPAVSPDVEETE